MEKTIAYHFASVNLPPKRVNLCLPFVLAILEKDIGSGRHSAHATLPHLHLLCFGKFRVE